MQSGGAFQCFKYFFAVIFVIHFSKGKDKPQNIVIRLDEDETILTVGKTISNTLII